MTRPLDASWVRVEDTSAPDGDGWELEQEYSELLVLDMGPAERGPAEERESMPGTSITLTVRVVSHTQGLETETPMMKLGDMVMMGQWDELLGSEIVLCQGMYMHLTHRAYECSGWRNLAANSRKHGGCGHRREQYQHTAYCLYACAAPAGRNARYPVAFADRRRPTARL